MGESGNINNRSKIKRISRKVERAKLAGECRKEIDDAFETINKDQAEYDKQLLTLSSATLVFSLAFIKDIVPLRDAEWLWLLYCSYILLGLCILLVLFSYQYSIAGYFKAIEYWEERQKGNNPSFPHGHANRVKRINRASGIFFGLGISLLIVFAMLNIHNNRGINMSNHREGTNDGAYIKTPNNGEERGSLIKAPPKLTGNGSKLTGSNNQSQKKEK